MEDQLRLDQCVAQKAVELKSTLQALSASNLRMEAVRAAAEPFVAYPPALAPFTAELTVEFGIQEALQAKWEIERMKWLIPGACGGATDFTLSMPDLSWTRLPPDIIGEFPFEWESTDFRIEVRDLQHAAAAQVTQSGAENEILGNWKARWQVPKGANLR